MPGRVRGSMRKISDCVDSRSLRTEHDFDVLRSGTGSVHYALYSGARNPTTNMAYSPIHARVFLADASPVEGGMYVGFEVLEAGEVDLGIFAEIDFGDFAVHGGTLLAGVQF